MAQMQKGLLGGFSGKVGSVVGYMRNRKQYVRSAPKKSTIPASMDQITQREKFSMMTKFLSPLRPFMIESHRYYYRNQNGYRIMFSDNCRNAPRGEHPYLFIEY